MVGYKSVKGLARIKYGPKKARLHIIWLLVREYFVTNKNPCV